MLQFGLLANAHILFSKLLNLNRINSLSSQNATGQQGIVASLAADGLVTTPTERSGMFVFNIGDLSVRIYLDDDSDPTELRIELVGDGLQRDFRWSPYTESSPELLGEELQTEMLEIELQEFSWTGMLEAMAPFQSGKNYDEQALGLEISEAGELEAGVGAMQVFCRSGLGSSGQLKSISVGLYVEQTDRFEWVAPEGLKLFTPHDELEDPPEYLLWGEPPMSVS